MLKEVKRKQDQQNLVFFGRFSVKKIRKKITLESQKLVKEYIPAEKISMTFKMAKELKNKIINDEGTIN